MQDKEQVADLDPSFWADDAEIDCLPCMVCEAHGEETQLMLCDGCDNTCHAHCADLDQVPGGEWFCYECTQNLSRTRAQPSTSRAGTRRTARSRPMTYVERENRERQRRERFEAIRYNRLRDGVYDATGIDLDFPENLHEYEVEVDQPVEREPQYANVNIWQRRLQIARTQGAGPRFERMTRNISRQPKVVSPEEVSAWKALDSAYGIAARSNSRKRKSRTPTPASDCEPRQYKRPRTFRQNNLESKITVAESSRSHPAQIEGPRPTKMQEVDTSASENFLQLLLNEAQGDASSSTTTLALKTDTLTVGPMSSRASSPASPVVSSYPTPSSMTPPMSPANRPSSPCGSIARSITPLPRPAHVYSPIDDFDTGRSRSRKRQTPSHSPHSSPIRITSEMKSDIQKMVGDALKPYYKNGDVSKVEYTGINRDVSRMMYDQVGHAGGLGGKEARDKWQDKVTQEVLHAVEQSKMIRADSD